MSSHNHERRRWLTRSLAVPLFMQFPWSMRNASALIGNEFYVPPKIHNKLSELYSHQATVIHKTDRLLIKAPDIAENGAVVPISIGGDRNYVLSLAFFVEENENPLVDTCRLYPGADLAVRLRVKVDKTSMLYLIAKTRDGMVGVSKQVKVTIGCMGG